MEVSNQNVWLRRAMVGYAGNPYVKGGSLWQPAFVVHEHDNR